MPEGSCDGDGQDDDMLIRKGIRKTFSGTSACGPSDDTGPCIPPDQRDGGRTYSGHEHYKHYEKYEQVQTDVCY